MDDDEHDDFDFDDGWPTLPRWARVALLALSVALAAGGVWWYVADPGVLSYQVGGLAIVPLLMAALVWLHRRLPMPVQWAAALALAIAGPRT